MHKLNLDYFCTPAHGAVEPEEIAGGGRRRYFLRRRKCSQRVWQRQYANLATPSISDEKPTYCDSFVGLFCEAKIFLLKRRSN